MKIQLYFPVSNFPSTRSHSLTAIVFVEKNEFEKYEKQENEKYGMKTTLTFPLAAHRNKSIGKKHRE